MEKIDFFLWMWCCGGVCEKSAYFQWFYTHHCCVFTKWCVFLIESCLWWCYTFISIAKRVFKLAEVVVEASNWAENRLFWKTHYAVIQTPPQFHGLWVEVLIPGVMAS